MLNPTVLKPLWVKQTSKWFALGEEHLKKLVTMTTDVAIKIFSEATRNIDVTERTKHRLEQKISDFGVQERKVVLSKLADLCHKNATLALQTNNPQFEQNVNKARAKRFEGALDRYRNANPPSRFLTRLFNQDALAAGPEVYERWAIVDDDYVKNLFNEIHPYGERAQNTQDEIHDLLKAYYDVGSPTFHLSLVPPNLLQTLTFHPIRSLSKTFCTTLNSALSNLFSAAKRAHCLGFRQTTY